MIALSIEEAIELLGVIHSKKDLIVWRGYETTPDELIWCISEHKCLLSPKTKAHNIRITYSEGKGRSYAGKIHGTLADMVKDRLQISKGA